MKLKYIIITIISILVSTNISFSQKPKNIILLIGDGMGINHLHATNNYYDYSPAYQKWDEYRMSTYNKQGYYNSDSVYSNFSFVNHGFTDSGAAATAMACGYKTHSKVIGMNGNYYIVKNVAEYAEEFGKSSGIVTTVPFNHATPAGFSAHVKGRYEYHKIASQMIIDSKLDVIIGCGNPYFDINGKKRNEPSYKYFYKELIKGIESGDSELVDFEGNKRQINSADDDETPDPWTYINTISDFEKLAEGKNLPKRLLGIPEVYSTLQSDRESEQFIDSLPDLATLSVASLNVLNQNEKGFFLMIEGGAIDWASHDSLFIRAVEETNDFNKAIEAVSEWVEKYSSWEETIVIVTADHETGYLTNSEINEFVYNNTAKNLSYNMLKPNNKKGSVEGLVFNNGNSSGDKCEHSNQLVPIFVKGEGCELFLKKIESYKAKDLNFDLLSNTWYIDNTDIAKILFKLLINNSHIKDHLQKRYHQQ